MKRLVSCLVGLSAAACLVAAAPSDPKPRAVTIPTSDGGLVHADLYGEGKRAVVLAHGGRYDKGSWAPQARVLSQAGFTVLAIDFRGYGRSRGPGDADPLSAPLHLDLLAAVRHQREAGATSVAIVGGSMGGGAAADAAIESKPGEIDRIVVLAASPSGPPEKVKGRKLFVTARGDLNASGAPRLDRIRERFERIPEPKELLVLEGSAHAQALFQTDQAGRLMEAILRFLAEE